MFIWAITTDCQLRMLGEVQAVAFRMPLTLHWKMTRNCTNEAKKDRLIILSEQLGNFSTLPSTLFSVPRLYQTVFFTPSRIYSFGIRPMFIVFTTFQSNRLLPFIAYFITFVLFSYRKGRLVSWG